MFAQDFCHSWIEYLMIEYCRLHIEYLRNSIDFNKKRHSEAIPPIRNPQSKISFWFRFIRVRS